jgi:integrase
VAGRGERAIAYRGPGPRRGLRPVQDRRAECVYRSLSPVTGANCRQAHQPIHVRRRGPGVPALARRRGDQGREGADHRNRYRGVLQRHVLPTLGNLELHEVNVGVTEDMLDTVAAQGIGAPTRRHIRIVVRDILHIAVRRGALPANPARELRRIRSTGRSLPRALTPEERDHLLAALRADTYAGRSSTTDLVMFMLGTGCRISEALAVRWRDVDLVGVDVKGSSVPVVSLGPVVVTVKGQGLVYRPKGKTGKNEQYRRLVPLPPFTVDMLTSRRPAWATLTIRCSGRRHGASERPITFTAPGGRPAHGTATTG